MPLMSTTCAPTVRWNGGGHAMIDAQVWCSWVGEQDKSQEAENPTYRYYHGGTYSDYVDRANAVFIPEDERCKSRKSVALFLC